MILKDFILYSLIFCNLLKWKLHAEDTCFSGDDGILKVVGFLDFVVNLLEEANNVSTNIQPQDLAKTGSNAASNSCKPYPMDCEEILHYGYNVSGVYKIWPRYPIVNGSVDVYCDMTTDGGGWTVFQRRGDYGKPYDYFNKDWKTYKKGFGNISEDFWLGNDLLFSLTNQRLYTLRVDLKDWDNNSRYAVYEKFWITAEESNYTLYVKDYKGNAKDALSHHSGRMFSTKDRDNDNAKGNCAHILESAWWFFSCYRANLNGRYLKVTEHHHMGTGIVWNTWKRNDYPLPFAEMKLRSFSYIIDH